MMLIPNMPKVARKKSEGKVVLGNGNGRLKFQCFDLPESLLENLPGAKMNPPSVPEVEIYVDGDLWEMASSFFGHKNDDSIYIVRRDTDGHLYIQFGDGVSGRRLPTGTNNIVAKKRSGAGKRGNATTN